MEMYHIRSKLKDPTFKPIVNGKPVSSRREIAHLSARNRIRLLWASAKQADLVTGCALLIKMPVVDKTGMLDERFFAYYEETEWCVRVSRAGYKILHVPQAKIWHKISPVAREASPQVHYYMTRNRLLFLKVTHAGTKPRLNTMFNYARILLSWTIKPKWRHKAPQKQAMLQAILDYFRGRFGRVDLTP